MALKNQPSPSKTKSSFLAAAISDNTLENIHAKTATQLDTMVKSVNRKKTSIIPAEILSSGNQPVQIYKDLNRKLKRYGIDNDMAVTDLVNEIVYKFCLEKGL